MQYDRVIREKNIVSVPALWRNDRGVIVYSTDDVNGRVIDIPYNWGNVSKAKLYVVFELQKNIKVKDCKMKLDLTENLPFNVIPIIK